MRENHTSRITVYQVTLFALLTTLASCGGSGGGGIAPPPLSNTAALPITADNAQDITESVLEAISSSVDLIDIVDIIGLPVVSSAHPGISKLAFRDINTQITACDTGEITTIWDDADNNLQVSTGDTFDTQFDMCVFQDPGLTIDGDSTVDNVVVTGDPANQVAPWSFVATFGFVNLIATDASGTVTINGDLDLDISSDDNVVVNASVGTASLTANVDGDNESLSDFLITQVVDLNVMTQIISTSGTFTSDILEGSVTFATLEDFMVMGEDNPSSGQLFISDSSSSVLFTVLDNMNVQLDIDLDLDGTIDETIVVTWTELDIE